MKTIIINGTVVNEGKSFPGNILIQDDRIADIICGDAPTPNADEVIDAAGCLVLPGVVDEHVHFREPGLTDKADIESESRAAAWGGVTTYFEMPNTVPQTTTIEALQDKYLLGEQKSHVNYAFFLGATNDNLEEIAKLVYSPLSSLPSPLSSLPSPLSPLPAVKLFMGSSTGNMLVDKREALKNIFRTCAELGLTVMTHCEDTTIINRNMAQFKEKFGDDPDVSLHAMIRSREACYESSALAVELARTYGTHLHIAHISTADELQLLDPAHGITGEVCVPHLLFDEQAYAEHGALVKCNPAVKTNADRKALREAAASGLLSTIGTDHAPHLLSQKQGGAAKAVSGMPMVQFSLVAMLGLVDEGVFTAERLVELMAHAPARLFHVRERGFLRKGYKADIAIVRPNAPWTLNEQMIQSKCKWSPLTGTTFNWRVEHTLCNGHHIYNNGVFCEKSRGEAVCFER